jgi:hypothetical protein
MKQPHKHRDLIIAWANDKSLEIQYETTDHEWRDASSPAWNEDYGYRIKPEVIRYRVAIFSDVNSTIAATKKDEIAKFWEEKNPDFKKWLTDWIEVEV